MPPRERRPSAKAKDSLPEEDKNVVKVKEEPIIDVKFGDEDDEEIPENIGDMLMGSDTSDSEEGGIEEDEPQVTVQAPASSTPVSVPMYSYFEVRGDRDKRAYVECFADILDRVKTNHHFRCKGCGLSIVGQYLTMLVHMAGTRNHLRMRSKACKNPIPAVRARILQDFEDYNAKEKYALAMIKAEPGQPSLLELSPKRGRKRTLNDILEIQQSGQLLASSLSGRRPPPARRSLSLTAPVLSTPANAAVYENAIRSRHSTTGKAVSAADVNAYYSTVLTKSADLKTSCCTTAGAPPLHLRQAFNNIHSDVLAKYYGCGFVAPDLLQGLHVLDLGCGAGRDCYVLSQLVGESGRVVGVDMSEAQLATARGTAEWHRQRFGYREGNAEFVQAHLETLLDPAPVGATSGTAATAQGAAGSVHHSADSASPSVAASRAHASSASSDMRDGTASLAIKDEPDSDSDSDDQGESRNGERLHGGESGKGPASLRGNALEEAMRSAVQEGTRSGLQRESFHVIVSNCVLNLSPDKAAVLNNAYELLRPGGELYFSDVYCTQRVPLALRQDPVLWGECLSGALYWNDFLRLARECGFADPRLVASAPVAVQNAELEARLAQHMPAAPGRNGQKAVQFYSATYRLFKIPELEPDCENYGQAVVYLGTMPAPAVHAAGATAGAAGSAAAVPQAAALLSSPLPLHSSAAGDGYDDLSLGVSPSMSPIPLWNGHSQQQHGSEPNGSSKGTPHAANTLSMFTLDDHHHFPTGLVVPVCGNTFRMLHQTRFRPHFRFIGEQFSQHFGIFEGCGKSVPFATDGSGGGCC